MASQPGGEQTVLPLFYKSIAPLSFQLHPGWHFTAPTDHKFAAETHAIPITVDEFVAVQRHFPIIFGTGPGAAPLALVGLAEGRNMVVDADGRWRKGSYIPAYVRRYPFLLARLNPDSEELSLCIDDSTPYFGPEGAEALFDGEAPAQATKNALEFCGQFEESVQRTRLFMEEVEKSGLVIDGEVTIQLPGRTQPAKYSGFRMIDENKLRELRGDQARKMSQSGMLGIIYAHLFSLPLIRDLYEQQEALVTDLLA